MAWNVVHIQEKSKDNLNRISNEIRLLKNLEHPKIINLLGAWLDHVENVIIFITEICSGGTLKNHIRRFKSLRKKIAKKWLKGILEG